MVLQRSRVEFLLIVTERNRQHIAVRVLAGQTTQAFETGKFSTQTNVEIQRGGIACDRGGVDLDAQGPVAPILYADVGDFSTGPDN